MKKHFLAVATLLLAVSVHAQRGYKDSNGVLENMTVEASYGYNMAISPSDLIETQDFSGFKTFQLGVRYQINDLWGVRGTYTNSTFEHKDFSDSSSKHHRLVAEATYNIIQKNNAYDFQLMGHAGLGAGIIKSETLSGNDFFGTFQVGITPEYFVTDRLGVFVDLTYMLNLSQNYSYAGTSIEKTTGSVFVPSLGLSFKLVN